LRVKFKPETADQPLLTTAQLREAAAERASGRPVVRMAPGPGDGSGGPRPAIRAVGGGTPEDAIRKNFEISEVRHFEGNVGYVRMDLFESPRLAGETFTAAMTFLQNVDALILDLRKNRGGAQPMVDYVASYFLPADGRTLLTSRFRGMDPLVARTFEVPGKRMESVPLYILISPKTFSAGEALPYILQKFGRATIVGEKTTGGGRHNALTNIGGGLEASISVSDVVHPVTKSSWQGTGVIPDIAVPADQALDAALTHARNSKRH
jgi:C-terminal processing protease CtpA/Prc